MKTIDYRKLFLNEKLISEIQSEFIKKISKDFYEKKDDIIKKALLRHGFINLDPQFLADNFQFIIKANDKFEHFYYHFGQPNELRIISIEYNTETKYLDKEEQYIVETTCKFY